MKFIPSFGMIIYCKIVQHYQDDNKNLITQAVIGTYFEAATGVSMPTCGQFISTFVEGSKPLICLVRIDKKGKPPTLFCVCVSKYATTGAVVSWHKCGMLNPGINTKKTIVIVSGNYRSCGMARMSGSLINTALHACPALCSGLAAM